MTTPAVSRLAEFVACAVTPDAALDVAAAAVRDTVGVTLAGAAEPAARMVQAMAADEGRGTAAVLGTSIRTSPDLAAMANGVAAHALDFDDMCFVSLAHPSCALFPAALAAGELAHASGRTLLEGYVAGFELECRLGRVMNPRHYHHRGWHCTSTIGTVGAAAAAARILGLDPDATRHALGIAASSACGLKENLGSMVKPLHAGLAARNGLMAARLAHRGYTASDRSLDGPQGFLHAMDGEAVDLAEGVADLTSHWEILASGITVKLYPSCAATHPALDVLLDIRGRERLTADDIEDVAVEVDSMTPRLLIYDRPVTVLEGKFSMPFCAAAALALGEVNVGTFAPQVIASTAIQALMPRVRMTIDPAFDAAPPLSTTRVTLRLRDGRTITDAASGARGYPKLPATEEQLAQKFTGCARRTLPRAQVAALWTALEHIAAIADVSVFAHSAAEEYPKRA